MHFEDVWRSRGANEIKRAIKTSEAGCGWRIARAYKAKRKHKKSERGNKDAKT